MQSHALAFLALDIASQRAREADEARLIRAAQRHRPSLVRRFAARSAAAIGLAFSRIATRLDDTSRRDALDHERGALA
jgi:hypothetical protein